MAPRRALLLVNERKAAAREAGQRVRALIESAGELTGVEAANGEAPPSDGLDVDLIVVVGGDGTLIAQARRFAALDIPLLGVNVGRLGFLAEFDEASLEQQAGAIFDAEQQLSIVSRRFLGATIEQPSRGAMVDAGVALNEFVVAAGPPFRMIELALSLDGEIGPTLHGDGVIVATPVGSTGHNVSAGGPIVSPGVECSIITPLAAHSLAFRPFIAPASSMIELRVVSANRLDAASGTTLVLDGQVHHALEEGDVVRISRSDRAIRLVRNTATGYWPVLLRKLGWAAPPARR